MTKTQAKKLFGTVRRLADVVGYSTNYFYQLPDELPPREADRIRGAALRSGICAKEIIDLCVKTPEAN